jgi:surface antigen
MIVHSISDSASYKGLRGLCQKLFLLLMIASVSAGCSMTFPMMALVDGPSTTGTLPRAALSPLSPDLGSEDWRRAKSALSVALDPHGNGSSVTWDNPESGLKGSFSPVGQPFLNGSEMCRAFLTALTRDQDVVWQQGTACRTSGSEWAIRDIKPWKKPS